MKVGENNMAVRGIAKFIPAFAHGHKVYPEHIAGMVGLPHVGNIFYVDVTNGSDTANAGTMQDDAYATVLKGEDSCTDGQHDVVIMAPESGSGRTTEATSIVWDKRFTHLIGNAAPISLDARAGMTMGSAAVTPSFTLSSNGCIFKDFTIAQFNDVNVTFALSGGRNYFEGVHFAGIGHATAGDDTAARSLELEGAEENRFVDCTFGLDTVTRTGANASVSQGGVCPRNQYIGCTFVSFLDAGDPFHFMVENNDGVQRFVLFRDCLFLNADTASSTTMTAVMDTGAALNGTVAIINSFSKGATDWADDFTHVFVSMALTDTDEGGLMKIGT